MSILIQYLVKLSISLGLVWLFYQFVLRRLTFYNANRWYLLACTLLSFFIPLINIAPVLESNGGAAGSVVRFIPVVQQYTIALEQASHCPIPIWSTNYDKWDWIAFGLIAGAGVFLLRFMIRCISFFRLRHKAKLVSAGEIRVYQVDKDVIPFSFGNSIFINRQLHDKSELQEIIRHEFVHVKQKHTHDIIWGELLCILNWYNPFAWLIRRAIRQNLEFIADHKVLENGVDRKQYQYLLLKVIGSHHFSIANQFNFSSLKKRIAMMNKMRSARTHLLKFLFLLPLVAVCLLAFRDNTGRENTGTSATPVTGTTIGNNTNIFLKDTSPVLSPNKTGPLPNGKGYHITIADNNGTCMVVIKDRNKKEVERLLLTKWNENKSYYENKYGLIPPPPPPVEPPPPPAPPAISGLPDHVRSIQVDNDHAIVVLKNGAREEYDLGDPKEKKAFQDQYAKGLSEPALPPAAPAVPAIQKMTVVADSMSWISREQTFRFKGKAFVENVQSEISVSAELIDINGNDGLVMINGREVDKGKDYINTKGGTYKLTSLNEAEAVKKYGEKGKHGALEIIEIPGPGL